MAKPNRMAIAVKRARPLTDKYVPELQSNVEAMPW